MGIKQNVLHGSHYLNHTEDKIEMNKSILIIDTPENCYNCGIRKGYLCGGVGGLFGKSLSVNLEKPDWCPLKEISELPRSEDIMLQKEENI